MYFKDFIALVDTQHTALHEWASVQEKLDAVLTMVKLDGHTVNCSWHVTTEYENTFGNMEISVKFESGEKNPAFVSLMIIFMKDGSCGYWVTIVELPDIEESRKQIQFPNLKDAVDGFAEQVGSLL